MRMYMCICACVPVYILPASVHADLHMCTHVCRPEVGIHVLLDHSPPVSKVRGGVSHLNPDLTDKRSLASHLNPWGICFSFLLTGVVVGHHALLACTWKLEIWDFSGSPCPSGIYMGAGDLGFQWTTMPYWNAHEFWTLVFTLVRQILFLMTYLPSPKVDLNIINFLLSISVCKPILDQAVHEYSYVYESAYMNKHCPCAFVLTCIGNCS